MDSLTWEQANQAIMDIYDKQTEAQKAYDEAMGNSKFLIESRYLREMRAAIKLVEDFKKRIVQF